MTDGLDGTVENPWDIVEEREDGSAVRRDGRELKSRLKNPWYVLATLYGDQDFATFDEELAQRNRHVWNLWAAQKLDQVDCAELEEKMSLTAEELGSGRRFDNGGAWATKEKGLLAKYRERLGKHANWPNPAEIIDLSNIYIPPNKFVSFGRYLFNSHTNFSNTVFGNFTAFNHTHFNNSVSFSEANFCGRTFFDGTSFNSESSFHNTKFGGTARFSRTTFVKEIIFMEARFKRRALFPRAIFNEPASFVTTHFVGDADFFGAKFEAKTSFSDARFKSNAHFVNTSFEKSADFSHSKFWANKKADFSNAIFNRRTNFTNSFFGGEASFRSKSFKHTTSFEAARFQSRAPAFHACHLYQDTRFTTKDAFWPEPALDNAENDKSAYVRLRQLMNELHKPDEEHFFLRRELRCKEYTEPFFEALWITLYRWFSKYGYSVWQPVMGLGAVVTIGWLILSIYFEWLRQLHGGTSTSFHAMGLSISNTFGFLGFNRLYFGNEFWKAFHPAIKVLGAAQTVFGVIFLFFLGLGLRNRFRLR